MELKNKKSAWAALATIGVTAIAAGTTAFVKMRKKREELRKLISGHLCRCTGYENILNALEKVVGYPEEENAE